MELEAVPERLPRVAADEGQLRQVLRANIVDNAVEVLAGGGEVRVRLGPVGRYVRFTVADQGLGIPLRSRAGSSRSSTVLIPT